MYITLVFRPHLKSSFCFLEFLSLPATILVVKLVVVAGLRLGPACVLCGSVELLISVLIRLFIIIASSSRSRLWFNLQVLFNAYGYIFLPFLVGVIQPAAGTLLQPTDT
jgi:hypothetical protein